MPPGATTGHHQGLPPTMASPRLATRTAARIGRVTTATHRSSGWRGLDRRRDRGGWRRADLGSTRSRREAIGLWRSAGSDVATDRGDRLARSASRAGGSLPCAGSETAGRADPPRAPASRATGRTGLSSGRERSCQATLPDAASGSTGPHARQPHEGDVPRQGRDRSLQPGARLIAATTLWTVGGSAERCRRPRPASGQGHWPVRAACASCSRTRSGTHPPGSSATRLPATERDRWARRGFRSRRCAAADR